MSQDDLTGNLELAVRMRAAADPTFRTALLADPVAVLAETFKLTIPETVRVRVLEEAADEVVLVLPAAMAADLSEAELAEVAGGTVQSNAICVTDANYCGVTGYARCHPD